MLMEHCRGWFRAWRRMGTWWYVYPVDPVV